MSASEEITLLVGSQRKPYKVEKSLLKHSAYFQALLSEPWNTAEGSEPLELAYDCSEETFDKILEVFKYLEHKANISVESRAEAMNLLQSIDFLGIKISTEEAASIVCPTLDVADRRGLYVPAIHDKNVLIELWESMCCQNGSIWLSLVYGITWCNECNHERDVAKGGSLWNRTFGPPFIEGLKKYDETQEALSAELRELLKEPILKAGYQAGLLDVKNLLIIVYAPYVRCPCLAKRDPSEGDAEDPVPRWAVSIHHQAIWCTLCAKNFLGPTRLLEAVVKKAIGLSQVTIEKWLEVQDRLLAEEASTTA